jgi:hypothetical protein
MARSSNSGEWPLISSVLSAVVMTVVVATQTMADDMIVLRNNTAQLSIALGGGGIVEFRFIEGDVNPLNWEVSPELERKPKDKPYPRGHFLCLDRWGAPSSAEEKNGIPFHGEAPRIVWKDFKQTNQMSQKRFAEMGCDLKLAGMRVKRRIRLDETEAIFSVTEEVTNIKKLGRIYNMVQHPSIAPPFLDETTLVDSNAEYGFVQDGPIPESSKSAARWPKTEIRGRTIDLRQFKNSSSDTSEHDVSSFMFNESDEFGWVTASTPRTRLLIGYIWKTQDYPWLNIWRYLYKGRVAARGLEFGTTGYHQPFGRLVRQGRILDRPLYEYIDAGQTIKKSYFGFLASIPNDYEGVASVNYGGSRLVLVERRKNSPRTIKLKVGDLSSD